MRFLVGQLADGNQDNVLQTFRDGPLVPTPADFTLGNGHYIVKTPTGVQIDTDGVTPPLSISTINVQKYSGLLAQVPQFTDIAYNPLDSVADLADIDTAATGHRAFMGVRGSFTLPHSVTNTAGAQPGLVTTTEITLGAAKSEFMVYWEVQSVGCLPDDDTTPATRIYFEEDATDLLVEISNDGGTNWTSVPGPMTNVAITTNPADTRVHLRFTNSDPTNSRNLAAYAVIS